MGQQIRRVTQEFIKLLRCANQTDSVHQHQHGVELITRPVENIANNRRGHATIRKNLRRFREDVQRTDTQTAPPKLNGMSASRRTNVENLAAAKIERH